MDNNQRSVLELPLKTERWQEDKLDKKMEVVRAIYNTMLSKKWKELQELEKTREWREASSEISSYYKTMDENGMSKKPKELVDLLKSRQDCLKSHGFTKFGFINDVAIFREHYSSSIPSNMAAESVAVPMWSAFEKILYGKGEKPHFKKYGSVCSLTTNGKSGMKLRYEDGKYYILISNMQSNSRPIKILINGPKNDYEREMIGRKIRQVRVIRKMEHTKYHYYCQLIVEGSPYEKLGENGERIHPIRSGKVGIAIWRNEICAVSESECKSWILSPGLEEYTQKREFLGREMERLRRQNNPQNYNEDGTIKNGIVINGVRQRLEWHDSNKYLEIKKEKRELERKNRETRNIYQNSIVNEILSMGDHVLVADTSFLTQKPEYDIDNPLTNYEYRKKKQRRKSIQEGAPSCLVQKIDKKLLANGGAVSKIKLSDSLYWYHHEANGEDKDKFIGDKVLINGELYSHTLYRAFLIMNYDEKSGTYDTNNILDTVKILSNMV